jgi:hypothetical protein
MAFPTNPTNGEQTTQNGIVYTYNAVLGVWSVLTLTPGDFGANNITATNQISASQIDATTSITGTTISASGNVTGAYILGNGSQLTGLPESYTNSNVAAYLPTYTGNLVSLTGAVTTTSNITGGNLITSGLVSATGNVAGTFFIGNGSQLTGIDATGIQNGNSNVRVGANSDVTVGVSDTANLAVFSTQGVNVTGNVQALFHTSAKTITANATIANINALSAGPITIADGVVVTVATGGDWSIV